MRTPRMSTTMSPTSTPTPTTTGPSTPISTCTRPAWKTPQPHATRNGPEAPDAVARPWGSSALGLSRSSSGGRLRAGVCTSGASAGMRPVARSRPARARGCLRYLGGTTGEDQPHEVAEAPVQPLVAARPSVAHQFADRRVVETDGQPDEERRGQLALRRPQPIRNPLRESAVWHISVKSSTARAAKLFSNTLRHMWSQ